MFGRCFSPWLLVGLLFERCFSKFKLVISKTSYRISHKQTLEEAGCWGSINYCMVCFVEQCPGSLGYVFVNRRIINTSSTLNFVEMLGSDSVK